MKKILLFTFLLIVFTYSAICQIKKGNWLVGGVINYSKTNYNSANYGAPHKAFELLIKPNIGYFIFDKLGTGIKMGIDKKGSKDANTTFYLTYTEFNIGPFVRYYLLPKEKNVNLLTEVTYQFGFDGGNVPKNTFIFSAGPVAYLNTSVGVEFIITYSAYKFSKTNGTNNTIMFGFGLQIHLEKDN